MELWEGFLAFDRAYPGRYSTLKQVSTALRRRGVDSMERLSELYRLRPDELLNIRGIGPVRLEIIGEVLRFYRTKDPRKIE